MSVNVEEFVARARTAQEKIANYNQEQVDVLVKAIGKVVYDNAEMLAKMAVEETGMGVYEDKVSKNKGKAGIIWNSLKNKKSVDIIGRNPARGLVYVAKPVGVVGSVIPCTNPIVTPMSNSMFAVKGRNAIIISAHPKALKCSTKTVEMINEELAKLGAPENLVQILPEASIEGSGALMKAVNVVVATGGMAMVKAAYSSGKPSLGVGQGNVQCIIDRDVDITEAVPKIIAGRKFDNGIICSGEQSAIIPEEKYDEVIAEFVKNGTFFINDPAQKEVMRNTLFPGGKLNKNVVGKSVQTIAKLAGIAMPADTKIIMIEADAVGRDEVLCKEKMCPVMISLKYKTFEDAVQIAKTNLLFEGQGHTVSIHSNNDAHIDYAGECLPISRLTVNQPCSSTAGGSFTNGLNPTTTLGCGTWGNNSMSENITYKHFINVSRIAYIIKDAVVPTPEELWG